MRIDFTIGGRLSLLRTKAGFMLQAEAPGKGGNSKIAQSLLSGGERWVRSHEPPIKRGIVWGALMIVMGLSAVYLAFWVTPLYYPKIGWFVLDFLNILVRYMSPFIKMRLIVLEFMIAILITSMIDFFIFSFWRKAYMKKIGRGEAKLYPIHPIISGDKRVVFKETTPNATAQWPLFVRKVDGSLEVYRGIQMVPPII